MGLDMYLNGKKFQWTDWGRKENNPTEDGYELKEKTLRLGYWRKHPDLHGFIVNRFAGGVDDCRDIELSADDLRTIIQAISDNRLPHTTGFFFGASNNDDEERKQAIEVFEKAIAWRETKEHNVSRSVHYRASW